MKIKPPIHVAWSTEEIDLSDPFQRTWYIRQVLLHGLSEDVRALDLEEVAQILDELDLPLPIRSLWSDYLKGRDDASR